MAQRVRMNPETGEVWEYSPGAGWSRARNVADDVGAGEAAMIALGRRMTGWGRTLRSIGADEDERSEIERLEAESDRLLAPLEERRPIATTLGPMLPELATGALGAGIRGGGILGRTIAGRVGSSATEQALLGAATGALDYEDTLSGRVFNMAVGAAGGAGGYGIGRMADRVRRQISAYARGGSATDVDLTTRGGVDLEGRGEGTLEGVRETQAARAARARGVADDMRGQLTPDAGPTATATRALRLADAENLGFELTPGMVRGTDTPIGRLEASVESFPPTSGMLTGVRARNYGRLQDYVGRALGLDGVEDLGVEVLDRAEAGIAQQFEDVISAVDQAGGINVKELQRATKKALEDLGPLGRDLDGRRVVEEVASVLEEAPAGAVMDGRTARRWRTYLNKRFRDFSAQQGNEASADVVSDLMRYFDDAIEKRVPRELRGTYRRAREQWRLLTTLRRGNPVQQDGTLNLRTFANNVRRTFGEEYRKGRASRLLPETQNALSAIRVMETFGRSFPDSGTASRLAVQNALDAPVSTAALTFGTSLGGDLYARTLGRATTQRTAAALGPAWPAAPTAAGAVGRALASQLEY